MDSLPQAHKPILFGFMSVYDPSSVAIRLIILFQKIKIRTPLDREIQKI
jgi:hypothetical protein